jgi:hypothetical protein
MKGWRLRRGPSDAWLCCRTHSDASGRLDLPRVGVAFLESEARGDRRLRAIGSLGGASRGASGATRDEQ